MEVRHISRRHLFVNPSKTPLNTQMQSLFMTLYAAMFHHCASIFQLRHLVGVRPSPTARTDALARLTVNLTPNKPGNPCRRRCSPGWSSREWQHNSRTQSYPNCHRDTCGLNPMSDLWDLSMKRNYKCHTNRYTTPTHCPPYHITRIRLR